MSAAQGAIHAMTWAEAPPRSNGELVFDAPWQGRAFAMAVALCDAGQYSWDEFRARLVEEIRLSPDGADYWTAWSRAVVALTETHAIVDGEELAARAASIAHDAAHEHEH